MSRTIALPDDRPRVAWLNVARDVPRAVFIIVAVLAALLFSGLLSP